MRIELWDFLSSENAIEKVSKSLGLPENVRCEIAASGIVGVNEAVRGLANMSPHKMSMAYFLATPPPLDKFLTAFAGDGYALQKVGFDPQDTQYLKVWEDLGKLKKDTLLFLTAATDPLFGIQYPYKELGEKLSVNKTFAVTYFGPSSLTEIPIPTNPWEVFVLDPMWGQENPIALILRGDRAIAEPFIRGIQNFHPKAVEGLLGALNRKWTSEEKRIQNFENEILKEQSGLFEGIHPGIKRLKDRAVLFLKKAHGDAVAHELGTKGFCVDTGASCRWNFPHLNSWLPPLGISGESVERSLVIPVEVLDLPNFKSQLVETSKKFSL